MPRAGTVQITTEREVARLTCLYVLAVTEPFASANSAERHYFESGQVLEGLREVCESLRKSSRSKRAKESNWVQTQVSRTHLASLLRCLTWVNVFSGTLPGMHPATEDVSNASKILELDIRHALSGKDRMPRKYDREKLQRVLKEGLDSGYEESAIRALKARRLEEARRITDELEDIPGFDLNTLLKLMRLPDAAIKKTP